MAKRTDKASRNEVSVPKNLPVKKSKGQPPPIDLASPEDLNALEEFCAGVAVDDTSFKDWQSCHQQLDLTIPVFVSTSEIAAQGTLQVTFSRSVFSKNPKGKRESLREKARYNLVLTESIQEGAEILVAGLGDRDGSHCGNLRIIIRIRRNS